MSEAAVDIVDIGSRVKVLWGTYEGLIGTVENEVVHNQWMVKLDKGFRIIIHKTGIAKMPREK